MQGIGILVGLVAAIFVYSEANKLKGEGAKLTPALWAIVVFLFVLLALPIYLILRITTWRRQISSAKGVTPSPLTSGQVAAVSVLSVVVVLGGLGTLALMAELWGLWEL